MSEEKVVDDLVMPEESVGDAAPSWKELYGLSSIEFKRVQGGEFVQVTMGFFQAQSHVMIVVPSDSEENTVGPKLVAIMAAMADAAEWTPR